MSRNKPYKHKKRGAGRFVQLHHWFMECEAWKTMKPGPRLLYIELKRRFTGSNNGKLRLSHREAAEALGIGKNTVGRWFKELEARGFIRMKRGPCLGPSGVGMTAEWALEEEATSDGRSAGKAFMRYAGKQNPAPKTGTPRPRDRDSADVIEADFSGSVPKTGTGNRV